MFNRCMMNIFEKIKIYWKVVKFNKKVDFFRNKFPKLNKVIQKANEISAELIIVGDNAIDKNTEKTVEIMANLAGYLQEAINHYNRTNPANLISAISIIKETAEIEKKYFGIENYRFNPEKAVEKLKKIKIEGFSSKDELEWIAELMQKTWSNTIIPATADWVLRTVILIEIIIEIYGKNRIKNIENYLISTFPGKRERHLIDRIKSEKKMLANEIKINSSYADMVARCLLVLLRDVDFKIKDVDFKKIHEKMKPWAFWIATKGLLLSFKYKNINTQALSEYKDINRKGYVNLSENPDDPILISAYTTLKEKKDDDSYNILQEFSGAFNIKSKKILVTFDLKSLYEFHETIDIFNHSNDTDFRHGNFGEWELNEIPIDNFFNIRKSDVSIVLSKEEFEGIIESIYALYNNPEVLDDIESEYFDIFGAF